MIHTAELNTEHVVDSEVITESESYLNNQGYSTDTVGYYTVVNQKPEGDNSGYLVKEIETTAVPLEFADVVEDRITVFLCTCPAYRYQVGIRDLEDRDTLEWDACKHVEGVAKEERAKNDKSQATL